MTLTNTSEINFQSERTLYETKIHWVSLILPVVKIVLGFLGFLILILPTSLFKILGAALTYILIKGILDFLYLKSLKISLSKNYLTINAGVISKTTIDIPLNKRENVCIYQTFLGRILNYGVFFISTGGISQSYKIQYPNELRNEILKQI